MRDKFFFIAGAASISLQMLSSDQRDINIHINYLMYHQSNTGVNITWMSWCEYAQQVVVYGGKMYCPVGNEKKRL